MPVLRLLITVASLLARPAAGADSGAAAKDSPPQDRCFCIQYTHTFPSPYYVGKLAEGAPECAGLKYDGKSPLESGLLSCDALRACAKGAKDYLKKKKLLADKSSKAKAALAACCAGGKDANCDDKCTADWNGILKVLTAETEKLERTERESRDLCVSKRLEEQKAKAAAAKTGRK